MADTLYETISPRKKIQDQRNTVEESNKWNNSCRLRRRKRGKPHPASCGYLTETHVFGKMVRIWPGIDTYGL